LYLEGEPMMVATAGCGWYLSTTVHFHRLSVPAYWRQSRFLTCSTQVFVTWSVSALFWFRRCLVGLFISNWILSAGALQPI